MNVPQRPRGERRKACPYPFIRLRILRATHSGRGTVLNLPQRHRGTEKNVYISSLCLCASVPLCLCASVPLWLNFQLQPSVIPAVLHALSHTSQDFFFADDKL